MSYLFSQKNKNNLHQVFLRYSWGAEFKKELTNEAERFIFDLEQNGLGYEVEKAIEQGKQAYLLGQDLIRLLNSDGQTSAEQWIDQISSQYPERVRKSLAIELDKAIKRRNKFAQRKATFTKYSNISPVVILDHHPLSLPHLPPCSDWAVYIDESGQYFSQNNDEHSLSNSDLGRVVALIVPKQTKLRGFTKPFHATEATSSEVDNCVQYILEQDVGIFGYTVNDPEALAANWYSHIVLLIRWVLMLLPMEPNQPTRVSFHIERNDAKLASRSIDSLASQIEGELQAINPERFMKLQLTTQLMDKSHPMNGYVDALAYTWGSPAAHSRDRLKKSALLGHCLLSPDQQSMHRLYLAAARKERLASHDWYFMCSAVADEPRQGFLHAQLNGLGLLVQKDLRAWQYYLDEVRERFRTKDYRLSEIIHALNWLEAYTPNNHQIPAIYRLPLETARLGHENHQGKVNLKRLQICLDLIKQLEEEDAQQACGALLRVAVSGNNNFEFKLLQPIIQQWLDKPVAISGLANYARLHSTIGQMHAFCHEYKESISHFDQAIALLNRLSDSQKSQREISQTTSYKYISLMDSGRLTTELLRQLAGSDDLASYSRQIAISSQNMRYPHHLWLRALIHFPKDSTLAINSYLQQSHLWLFGEDHPWGLIAAYRAWLLFNAGRGSDATSHFDQAIDLCSHQDNGPVLWWMAETLRTLARAIGISTKHQPSQEERDRLKKILPAAPHEQLHEFALVDTCNNTDALEWLKQCLPFNFH